MKTCWIVGLGLSLAAALWAEDPVQIDATLGVTPQWSGALSSKELATGKVTSPWLDLVGSLSMNSDGEYGSDIAYFRNSGTFFNNYFLMEEGYTTVHLKPLELSLGRQKQYDTFDSPYSLFVNSKGLSAPSMVVSFDSAHFEYESRWIELNSRSNFGSPNQTPEAWRYADGHDSDGQGQSFPDRGANLKTFAFKAGTMRAGFQEAAIYTGRSFDAEYLLNPIPEYFIQYYKGTAGRPWTTESNENYLMGLFWEWKEPDFRVGAQVLDDDFNLNFLSNAIFPNNPWKAAWTVGGQVATETGWWGLYTAGALKYTFEPITTSQQKESTTAYGYTYYPDTQYWASGSFRTLTIEDNSIGYLHGENNFALMVTWKRDWSRVLKTNAYLEFLLAGSNSPSNPWQDLTGGQEDLGTHWLDDPVLEKSLVAQGEVTYLLGDWELYGKLKVGFVWNVLTLQYSSSYSDTNASSLDRYSKIYKASNDNQFVGALALGVTYHFDLSGYLATLAPVQD